jgi:hypothetical protein
MQKLIFTLFFTSAIPLCGMELPGQSKAVWHFEEKKAQQSWGAEPSKKSVVHILDEMRFPVAVSEDGSACVYAAYNLYAKNPLRIVWDNDTACLDAPDFADGLCVPSRRPIITPDGKYVLSAYDVFGKRYKMAFCSRDEPSMVRDIDFGNYYDTINLNNAPFIDTDIPYGCMLDGERVFFSITQECIYLHACSAEKK